MTDFCKSPSTPATSPRRSKDICGGDGEVSSPDLMGERLRAQSHRIVAHLEEKVAELSHANDRLLDLDRARNEFYRNISHELATPMTPIVGYLKLLGDEELGPMNTSQLKALRAMDDCVEASARPHRQPARRLGARDREHALFASRLRLPRHHAARGGALRRSARRAAHHLGRRAAARPSPGVGRHRASISGHDAIAR